MTKLIRWAGIIGWLACFCSGTLFATTIKAPTFDGLVNEADEIVHARVVQVHAFRDSYEGRPLVRTEVTLAVEQAFLSKVDLPQLTLRFLGGRVHDLEMRVDGMPRFRAGEEVVLFVRGQGRQICPLVGWGHGKLLVERDAVSGATRLRRSNGELLVDLRQVSAPLETGAHSRAMARDQAADSAGVSLAALWQAVRETRRSAEEVGND